MIFRGGEFSTGEMGNFHPALTLIWTYGFMRAGIRVFCPNHQEPFLFGNVGDCIKSIGFRYVDGQDYIRYNVHANDAP